MSTTVGATSVWASVQTMHQSFSFFLGPCLNHASADERIHSLLGLHHCIFQGFWAFPVLLVWGCF